MKKQPYKREQIPRDTLTTGMLEAQVQKQQQKIEQLEHQNNVLTSKLSASAIELQRAKRLLQASQRKVYITGILFMCALVMALALAIR